MKQETGAALPICKSYLDKNVQKVNVMVAKCVFAGRIWLLHSIHSVRSQLCSDLKAGSKFIHSNKQNKKTQ